MCGIVGYTGTGPALPVLLDGLRALEYRGYDSAGVALISGNGKLEVARRAGKVADLASAAGHLGEKSSTGIGHTRWATCGAPTEPNAHPHRDCTGKVAVVHNGIIENHVELRDRLEGSGHTFSSQTDTECLAHLIEEKAGDSGGSLAGAVRAAVSEIRGSLAMVVVSSDHPGEMVAVRMDCPLIVAWGAGENLAASDPVAVLAHSRTIMYLHDGQVAHLTPGEIVITDLSGNPQKAEPMEIDWDVEAAEKEGYADFMLKEIHEQPTAVTECLRGRWQQSGSIVMDELRISDDEIRSVDKVFVVACGSSFHAGLVAKYAIEHWTRLPVEIDVASEFRYRDPVLDSRTLLVGISQSGETADTLAAVRYARRQKAKVVAITNVVGSSITREADAVLYTRAGPEVGVAATKTLTTQMSALWLLALWMAQLIGTEFPEETKARLAKLNQLPDLMQQVLSRDEEIKAIAEKYAKARTYLFIGRGVGYPVALEGALKLKEISYLHAEGFAAGEMKHGPIALVDEDVTVIAVATTSHTHSKILSNIEEAKARGGKIVAVANRGDRSIAGLADDVLEVPPTMELLSPLVDVIPLQLFSYYISKRRGLDPDKPRNLAKSVTVE
ncbi:MAG: glutamine--fructose-6-phosphate transaminase (isomerizing) [Actinomycetota bacterium]